MDCGVPPQQRNKHKQMQILSNDKSPGFKKQSYTPVTFLTSTQKLIFAQEISPCLLTLRTIVTTTPPATLEDVPVVDLATCPSHCTERLVDAAVAATLLRNAVRLGTDPATNLERICVCPCGNGNCAAWGPGCECVDTEPPELFDITSDPGAFTLDCGPGFFPCPIVESSNE